MEHKRVKRFAARTNRVFTYTRQVASHERRVRIIKDIEHRLEKENTETPGDPRLPFEHSDPIPPTEPEQRYKISTDRSQWEQIPQFMNQNRSDPAVQVSTMLSFVFIPD